MASLEELQEQVRVKRLRERVAAKRAAQSRQAPPKKEGPKRRTQADKDSTANLSNRLRTWGKGAMLGFQDEAEGLLQTLLPETEADKIAREMTGGDKQSFRDELAMRQGDVRKSQKQYAQDNPWEAAGLELTGAVMSPVNRIAPGVGTQGSALSRAAALGVRGAAEGAVTGFGEGEGGFGERLDNAKTGAAWGGGLGTGMSLGGGYLGRKISDSKVAENMRDLKNQMPLNLADPEGSLGKFYRNVVGLAYGGGGKLGKQESKYLNASPKMARFRDEAGDVVEQGTTGTKRMVEDIKGRVRASSKIDKGSVDDELRRLKDTDIPAPPKAVTDRTVNAKTNEGLAQTRAKMRADQANDALPPHVPDDVRVAVNTAENPSLALREMDKYWKSDDAFGGVKKHTYDLDDNLYGFLKRSLDPEADAQTLEMLEEAFEAGGGTVSGKWLMEMRNRPAIGSGTKTGMPYGKARQSVKKWDKQIERQLKSSGNTPALKQFRNDKAHYGQFKAYENATGKAVGRGDVNADWTEQDLWKSGGNKTQRDRQMAPGQSRARAVKEEAAGLEQSVRRQEEQAREAAQAANKQAKLSKAKEKARLENRKKRLGQREEASINRIDRETRGLLPEDSTFWSRAAATAGLGAPFAGLTVAGALPTGIAVSSVLASPRVQRFMAGQGPAQDALREALERGDTALVTQILTRIGAMEATEQE